MYAVVIDTCVFYSALYSRNGASFKILSSIDIGKFEISLSVPLVFEYEAVAKRNSKKIKLSFSDIDDIINYLCKIGHHRSIHFLWRPKLKDPADDFVLELAVESECDFLITHNIKDFKGSDQFGVKVITPKKFLQILEATQ